jgi:hypothetical protein
VTKGCSGRREIVKLKSCEVEARVKAAFLTNEERNSTALIKGARPKAS